MTKNYWQCEVNDWLTTVPTWRNKFQTVGKIIKLNALTYTVQLDNGSNVTVQCRTGKQRGSEVYWTYCPDPDVVRQANQVLQHEKESARQQLLAKEQRQLERAKQANPYLDIKPVGLDVYSVTWYDAQQQENLLVFRSEVYENDWKGIPRISVHLTCYGPSEYAQGSTTHRLGQSLEEVLYTYMSDYFKD